jgi:hypothetical protein
MKPALVLLAALAALSTAAAASAGGNTMTTVLNGMCTDIQTLDSNGALKSLTVVCKTTGACTCERATKLVYSSKTLSPGNGADGRETGTLVAASAVGTVTLTLTGKQTALGVGTGTWTLGKVKGYTGIHLAGRGKYAVTTRTLSQVVGTFKSVVRMNASFGCWACAGSWVTRRIAVLLAATALAGTLAACGTTSEQRPRAHSATERVWIDNTLRLLATVDSDIVLSTAGGGNLATARRALSSESAVYTMLVAYTFFGNCSSELRDAGTPTARAENVVEVLADACRRLSHAASLFQQAVTRNRAAPLLAAGQASLAVEPLVVRARQQLQALRRS